MVLTINTSIILHNMIVEARLNGYKSELWKLTEDSLNNGMFIHAEVTQNTFHWSARDGSTDNQQESM